MCTSSVLSCLRFAVSVVFCVAALNGAAQADCIDDVARHYQINADLLRSIAYYESGINPTAVHRNRNGSVDIGLMQINSIHLPALHKEGIGTEQLRVASVNAEVGASLLLEQIKRYGQTWRAVGAYHSQTLALADNYARGVYRVYASRAWERTTERIAEKRSPSFSVVDVSRN